MTEIGGFADESVPQGTPPTGPTDHLETVEYWKGLYLEAIEVGKERTAIITSLAQSRVLGLNDDGSMWVAGGFYADEPDRCPVWKKGERYATHDSPMAATLRWIVEHSRGREGTEEQ